MITRIKIIFGLIFIFPLIKTREAFFLMGLLVRSALNRYGFYFIIRYFPHLVKLCV